MANITFRQLLWSVPAMRTQLVQGLQKKVTTKRKSQTFVNLQPTPTSTALYCDAVVNNKIILLIVDSGSSGSVVSSYLLSELGVKVKRPSTVNMVNVHGQSKRAIGEISNFPFFVGGVRIPIDVVVTDALSYQAIVGNDWLSKVQPKIDYNASEMALHWENEKIIVLVEFRRIQHNPIQENHNPKTGNEKEEENGDEFEIEEEEEVENEYEEEELEDGCTDFQKKRTFLIF